MVCVSVHHLRENARTPTYMTTGAAGMDLYAALETPLVLPPGGRSLVPTGIALAIPPGYEGQVRPRSGLALRHGLTMLNSPGTIDCDYRGEIGLIVINHGQEPVTLEDGDRVAQLVIAPVIQVTLAKVDDLQGTDRGHGGFGHTGLKGKN